ETALAAVPEAEDYGAIVAVAWAGALLVEGERRSSGDATTASPWRAVGLVVAVAAVVALGIDPVYHAYYRLIPLATGGALALAASGPPGLRVHRRGLAVLGIVPLLDPPLRFVR